MFSSTAYEAFYQYIGLGLHSRFIEIITSQKVFLATLLLIFGVMFFMTCVRFVSRSLPGSLVAKKSVPLSAFVRVIACLFLGISLLKVQSHTSVKKFKDVSWHTNGYITKKIPEVAQDYRVSFIFDLMTRSAEEIARFFGTVVDSVFKTTNSQLNAPNFFYKAILLGAAQTIEDGDLRSKIDLYSSDCFEKALPVIEQFKDKDIFDRFLGRMPDIDTELKNIKIGQSQGSQLNCLDLKEEMRAGLVAYYLRSAGRTEGQVKEYLKGPVMNERALSNLWVSQWLVNQQLEKREGFLGIPKGSEIPGTGGKILRYAGRIFHSFDGLLHLFGLDDLSGVGTANERAEKFANDLSRAPHIAGFIKMILIMIFPFLVFFVVAGRWKILLYWWMIYGSVLLWAPIWTLFYHIITTFALTADVMKAFGELHDNVSLYSASLITARVYKMYSIYAFIQLLLGPLPTAFLAYTFAPMLRDTADDDKAPDVIEDARKAGQTAAGALL